MGVQNKQPARRNIVFLQVAVVVLVLGLILLIVGGVLLAESQRPIRLPEEDGCKASSEAESTDLVGFLKQVEDVYYKLHPYKLGSKPGVSEREVRESYRAYDPSPSKLRQITDQSLDFLNDINVSKSIDEEDLKPRERKLLAQVKFFLKFNFGSVYESNFYNGDFMLGPNSLCASPICEMGHDFMKVLPYFKPSSVSDIRLLKDKLMEFNTTIERYISNLEEGVKAGLVLHVSACKAGLEALRSKYKNIALDGEQGAVNESFAQVLLSTNFTGEISSSVESDWKSESRETVRESLRKYAVEYVGRSFATLMRYLETEHMSRCTYSKVSNGLPTLPVSFVFLNGTQTSTRTTDGLLPGTTDLFVKGREIYQDALRFFTSADTTPEEVYDLGWTLLNKLYPEMVEIAKNVTLQSNNNTAKTVFLNELKNNARYFNEGPIPSAQSVEQAQHKCFDMKSAEANCRQRLEAVRKWMDETLKVMALIGPKAANMFHFTGNRTTAPNCPVNVVADFSPYAKVQAYEPAGSHCSHSAKYLLPFWKQRPGPSYSEWGANAHMIIPGHHIQAQGYYQNFQDNCNTPMSKQIGNFMLYPAFVDGWGMYAESPLIAEDTDLYGTDQNSLFYKYGTIRWQVWRAIRLIVDTCLNYQFQASCSREWAVQLLIDRGWAEKDEAEQEISRYQSSYGYATADIFGQQRIVMMRDYAKEQLKDRFNMKDFHFFLLYQGPVPLDYLEESMRKYVSCTQDDSQSGCGAVLHPLRNTRAGAAGATTAGSSSSEAMDSQRLYL